jgi:hypothetical protein
MIYPLGYDIALPGRQIKMIHGLLDLRQVEVIQANALIYIRRYQK